MSLITIQAADTRYQTPVSAANPLPVSATFPAVADASSGVATTRTTAVAGSIVLKTSAGNLYGFNVVAGASAGYVMVYNSTTVPADGATQPFFVMPVAANAGIAYNFDTPLRFSTGIVLVFSTTGPFTKTISATAFLGGQFA
jgi:hypothetical protein